MKMAEDRPSCVVTKTLMPYHSYWEFLLRSNERSLAGGLEAAEQIVMVTC